MQFTSLCIRIFLCYFGVLFFQYLSAQEIEKNGLFQFEGYLETYYSFDFARPSNQAKQDFLFSFNRHNEFTANLGLLQAKYKTEKVRANLGLMAGVFANDNQGAEPGVLKNIFQANVGFKLAKQKNLWIDMGIIPAHIGFESAKGAECWSLTRGLLAENSPYYESGLKLSYTSENEKWYLAGLLLNGWQRIQRLEGNNTPAFGHQITFTPHKNITLNSSSFIGTDTPDSTRQMRYFHNFYTRFQLSDKWGIITGFDIGFEQQEKGSKTLNTWFSPIVVLRYTPTEKLAFTARGEYFSDENEVIIATQTPNGFQTWGYSMGLDYRFTEFATWRIEGRTFQSKDEIFMLDGQPSQQNYFITSSFAVFF